MSCMKELHALAAIVSSHGSALSKRSPSDGKFAIVGIVVGHHGRL